MVMNVTQPVPAGLNSVGIEVNGQPVPSGFKVSPFKLITLVAQLNHPFGKVRFSIENASGNTVFGPLEKITTFSSRVAVDTVAPGAVGLYTVVFTEVINFLPDNTKMSAFEVSANPDPEPPPKPKGGGVIDFLGSLQGVLVAGAVVVGLAAVAPAIKRVSEVGKR